MEQKLEDFLERLEDYIPAKSPEKKRKRSTSPLPTLPSIFGRQGIQNTLETVVAPSQKTQAENNGDPPVDLILETSARALSVINRGLLTWPQAQQLFRHFFDTHFAFAPFLDPVFDQPQSVHERSTFLFNAICLVSSRHLLPHGAEPGLYRRLVPILKASLLASIFEPASLETMQGLCLMVVWHWPVSSPADDKTWLMIGWACRMGYALNMHLSRKPATKEAQERVKHGLRTWIACYVLDRGVSSAAGKPGCIEDEAMTVDMNLLKESTHVWDSLYEPYIQLHRITGRISSIFYSGYDHGAGGRKGYMPDFTAIRMCHKELDEWFRRWRDIPDNVFPAHVLVLALNVRLSLNMLALQAAVEATKTTQSPRSNLSERLSDCISVISAIIRTCYDKLHLVDMMKYELDFVHVILGHATIVLIKLQQFPFVDRYMDRAAAFKLAQQSIEMLLSAKLKIAFAYAHYIRLMMTALEKSAPRQSEQDAQETGDEYHSSKMSRLRQVLDGKMPSIAVEGMMMRSVNLPNKPTDEGMLSALSAWHKMNHNGHHNSQPAGSSSSSTTSNPLQFQQEYQYQHQYDMPMMHQQPLSEVIEPSTAEPDEILASISGINLPDDAAAAGMDPAQLSRIFEGMDWYIANNFMPFQRQFSNVLGSGAVTDAAATIGMRHTDEGSRSPIPKP